MTRNLHYARDGYSYFSVETPSFFREYELPTNPERDNPVFATIRAELAQYAERYGTYVARHAYRRG